MLSGFRGGPVNPGTVDLKAHSDAHSSPGGGDSLTQQQFREENDINTMMRRFNVTGAIPAMGLKEPMYGDFTGIEDFETAVEKVEKARQDFLRLPPELRERFGNDPGELIAYARSHSWREFAEESERIAARRDALIAAKAAQVAAIVAPAGSSSSATGEAPK